MSVSGAYKKDPDFLARVTTAAVLGPLMIAAVWYLEGAVFAAVLALILLLGAWEWTRIVGVKRVRFRSAVVISNALIMLGIWQFLGKNEQLIAAEIGVLWWCFALLWLKRISFAQTNSARNSELKVVVGSLLMVPAWCAAILLHEAANGPMWTLFLFVLIWSADVGAYFSGRRFGNKKLAPNISPGKTREGVYGALAVSALVAFLFANYLDKSATETLFFVGLCLITVVFSVVGDLFESLMKRHANIKDSGSILPGHGGILDRIDSLLAALPVFVAGKIVLGL